MTHPDYGKTFAVWRAGAGQSWHDYINHDFVEGLRDGSLPRASFLHYLIQDYVYLVHYARAWSLGVIKAETLDEMKICAGTVNTLVNLEMSLHVATCTAAGISEEALFDASETTENLAYTRYVMDAGMQGDFLDLMAALAPCVMGYGEIGLRLAKTAAKDTPYADWIAVYSGDEYQQACRTVGAMIDQSVERRIGHDMTASPRLTSVQSRFTKATDLEVGFWDMGLRGK